MYASATVVESNAQQSSAADRKWGSTSSPRNVGAHTASHRSKQVLVGAMSVPHTKSAMERARMAATRTWPARPVALTALVSISVIASTYSSISPPSTTAVASSTLHEAYCSAGLATPLVSPATHAGIMTSSTLDSTASRPSKPVAYCDTALNSCRRADSRRALRFSVGMVEASDNTSPSLVERAVAERAARLTCESASSSTELSGSACCSSNSAKSSSRSRAVVTESATV